MSRKQRKISLVEWIEKISVNDVAEKIKVTPCTVRKWRAGDGMPNAKQMLKIRAASQNGVSFDQSLDELVWKKNSRYRIA